MPKQIKAVLFDLDGTMLDTAVDLAQALNRVLEARNIEPIHHTLLRSQAGSGARGLLKIGMNITQEHPDFAKLCDELLNHYATHACDTTTLFPGMETVLTHLENINIPWGIVTNKPERFTTPLIQHLGLTTRAACVISGDTLAKSKPHPDQLLHACELLQKTPANCLYVGDSEVDMLASKAAGMKVLAALYGYIPAEENPRGWNADGYINHPEEILPWLAED